MKTTILVTILAAFPIHVHMKENCPDTSTDATYETYCGRVDHDCESNNNGVGICKEISGEGKRCCRNKIHPDDFKTSVLCNEHQIRYDKYHSYCKDDHIFYLGRTNMKIDITNATHCDVNSDCGERSYCVVFRKSSDNEYKRRCYVIDAPKIEKENNTLLIIIIAAAVLLLIVIVGIVVGILVCKKMKKRKGGNKNSAESSANSEDEKKEKMKKPKKTGWNV